MRSLGLRLPRHPPRQHLGHGGAVDVLPAQHEADAASPHAVAFLEERCERRSAGSLRDRMDSGEIDADRLHELRFRDFDDAVSAVSDDVKRLGVRQGRRLADRLG